jgi:prepilin signal peptidase PulO-like enzyme (type II secretory pathway)
MEAKELFELVFLLYVSSSLALIFVYDVRHYLIPDSVLLPAIVVAMMYQAVVQLEFFVGNSLWAALGAFSFFAAIFFISKGEWMGFGDAKLAVLLGLILGFPSILLALFLAFFFGAIIGVVTMAYRGKGLKSQMPFAPFLILGTFVSLFWGNQIMDWYLSFFII